MKFIAEKYKIKTESFGNVFLRAFMRAGMFAYALTTTFHAPLVVGDYESKIDYLTASIYELLGSYDFDFLLILAAGFIFFRYTEDRIKEQKSSFRLLAFFFAGCLLIGQSYDEVGNWSYCFGSIVNFVKSILSLLGYAGCFQALMCLLAAWLKQGSFVTEQEHFFSKRAFLKAFLILAGCYSVSLILSYPGNLCWDVIGQIEQVVADSGYSTHHPLAHTLIVGGCVKLGKVLFDSYEIGLFGYMWFQMLLFAAALAGTIMVLAKRKAKMGVLVTLMTLYIVTPIYSNLVSTAIKDIPFCAFVIGYVICFSLLLENGELLKNIKFVVVFVLMQVGVILFRNNGLPLVVLCGIGGILYCAKKYRGADKKIAEDKLKNVRACLVFLVAGVVLGSLISSILVGVCDAESGSKGEILSIPFQQTARYLQLYKTELSEGEWSAIEAVLGDVETIADKYDPDISDPVKGLYKKDAGAGELLNYFGAWLQGLWKHPAVYVEAFLAHIHGWFTPSVSNAIRYEVDYWMIEQGGLFPNADKVMVFLYRFANRFTPLGALENIGLVVWALFFLTAYQKKNKQSALMVSTLPLWVSLLVCMASPCFHGHPRYALPILTTLPFLFGFMLSKEEKK